MEAETLEQALPDLPVDPVPDASEDTMTELTDNANPEADSETVIPPPHDINQDNEDNQSNHVDPHPQETTEPMESVPEIDNFTSNSHSVFIKQEVMNHEEIDDKSSLFSAHNGAIRKPHTTQSSCRTRVTSLKNDLHDKGSLLANTWQDLYNLLGEYQAELFSNEENILLSKESYEEATNDQLRSELVEKDNIIRELEDKLSLSDAQIETVRLDLSVKNSLLNKYQQELLEKESILLTTQAAKQKVDNKNRALETRLAARLDAQRMQTPIRPVGPIRPGSGGRAMPALNRAISSGLMNTRITPGALKRRGPMMSSLLQNTPKRRPPHMTPHSAPHSVSRPTPQPKPAAPATIVCIDDDDDDVKVIQEESQGQTNQDSLYMSVWPEQQQQETDTTNEQSLPGSMEQFQGQNFDQSQLAFDEANMPIDGTIPESALQGWDQLEQPGSSQAMMQSMMQQAESDGSPQKKFDPYTDVSPEKRKWTCDYCLREFSFKNSRDRHQKSAHEMQRFQCPFCPKTFGRKDGVTSHVGYKHPIAYKQGFWNR